MIVHDEMRATNPSVGQKDMKPFIWVPVHPGIQTSGYPRIIYVTMNWSTLKDISMLDICNLYVYTLYLFVM